MLMACSDSFFFCHSEVKNMTFDHNKTAPKKRKKQLPAKEMGEERRSTLSIRYTMSYTCVPWQQQPCQVVRALDIKSLGCKLQSSNPILPLPKVATIIWSSTPWLPLWKVDWSDSCPLGFLIIYGVKLHFWMCWHWSWKAL